MVNTPIYLDYSATTPVDPRVAAKMIPYLTEMFGNPASRSHVFGWDADKAVEEARGHVAALVNADPEGNRLDLRRHRVQQPRHQGRGAFLSRQGQAPDHREDRAQGGAGYLSRAGARRLRSHLSGRAAQRPDRPGRTQGGDPPGHHPGFGDAREQRNRRDPGHPGHRRTLPRARASCSMSTRRRRPARWRSTWPS